MRIFMLVGLLALSACASVSKEVQGPGGYSYKESIRASGRSNIEAAAQQFGGSLIVDSPDGLHVEAELDSQADAKGVVSDNSTLEALTGLIQLLNTLVDAAAKSASP